MSDQSTASKSITKTPQISHSIVATNTLTPTIGNREDRSEEPSIDINEQTTFLSSKPKSEQKAKALKIESIQDQCGLESNLKDGLINRSLENKMNIDNGDFFSLGVNEATEQITPSPFKQVIMPLSREECQELFEIKERSLSIRKYNNSEVTADVNDQKMISKRKNHHLPAHLLSEQEENEYDKNLNLSPEDDKIAPLPQKEILIVEDKDYENNLTVQSLGNEQSNQQNKDFKKYQVLSHSNTEILFQERSIDEQTEMLISKETLKPDLNDSESELLKTYVSTENGLIGIERRDSEERGQEAKSSEKSKINTDSGVIFSRTHEIGKPVLPPKFIIKSLEAKFPSLPCSNIELYHENTNYKAINTENNEIQPEKEITSAHEHNITTDRSPVVITKEKEKLNATKFDLSNETEKEPELPKNSWITNNLETELVFGKNNLCSQNSIETIPDTITENQEQSYEISNSNGNEMDIDLLSEPQAVVSKGIETESNLNDEEEMPLGNQITVDLLTEPFLNTQENNFTVTYPSNNEDQVNSQPFNENQELINEEEKSNLNDDIISVTVINNISLESLPESISEVQGQVSAPLNNEDETETQILKEIQLINSEEEKKKTHIGKVMPSSVNNNNDTSNFSTFSKEIKSNTSEKKNSNSIQILSSNVSNQNISSLQEGNAISSFTSNKNASPPTKEANKTMEVVMSSKTIVRSPLESMKIERSQSKTNSKTTKSTPTKQHRQRGRKRKKDVSTSNYCRTSHPYAPLGQAWIETLEHKSNSIHDYKERKRVNENNKSSIYSKIPISNESSLLGRKWVWNEKYYENPVMTHNPTENPDESDDSQEEQVKFKPVIMPGRTRRSNGINTSSMKLSQVISELSSSARGNKLSPYTLINMEPYQGTISSTRKSVTSGKEGSLIQPFSCCVSPDVMFLADLHAHVVDCEVIGLLGGRWDKTKRCVFIQAAFPCKATQRYDSGSTDVEMDPVSQVMVQNVIQDHGMMVVGWYHSHPTFKPDPSVLDVENQGNYQNLFVHSDKCCGQRRSGLRMNNQLSIGKFSKKKKEENKEVNEEILQRPFLGLIIGTYDVQNPSLQSKISWFHVVPKETGNLVAPSTMHSNSFSQHYPSSSNSIFLPQQHSSSSSSKNPLLISPIPVSTSAPGDDSSEDITTSLMMKERIHFPMELTVKYGMFRDHVMEMDVSMSKTEKECAVGNNKEFDDKIKLQNDNLTSDKILTATKSLKTNGEEKVVHGKVENNVKSELNVQSSRIGTMSKNNFSNGVNLMHASNTIHFKANHTSNTEARLNKNQFENERTKVNLNNQTSMSKKIYYLRKQQFCEVDFNIFENNLLNSLKNDSSIAPPLPFTQAEYDLIVNKEGTEEILTDHDKASLIWCAVVREQNLDGQVYFGIINENFTKKQASLKSASNWTAKNIALKPASSHSILNSLYLKNNKKRISALSSLFPSSNSVKIKSDVETGVIDASNDFVLIDAIDAVLSYYCNNPQRVDMMEKWNWDANRHNSKNSSSNASQTKVENGVKLCTSLLRWCKRMQLSSKDNYDMGGSYVLFIAEIMRLLASKWREADEENRGRNVKKVHKKYA